MPARIRRLQIVVLIQFLAGLDSDQQLFPVIEFEITRVRIQNEFRINQVAMILD